MVRGNVVRAPLHFIVLAAFATPAAAQSFEILGYAGVLGEWEVAASVSGNNQTNSFSGPMIMTHVGICTVDGPEQKKGEIRIQVSPARQASSLMSATLLVDGVQCTYSGRLSDSCNGVMNCPERAPIPLKIWLK